MNGQRLLGHAGARGLEGLARPSDEHDAAAPGLARVQRPPPALHRITTPTLVIRAAKDVNCTRDPFEPSTTTRLTLTFPPPLPGATESQVGSRPEGSIHLPRAQYGTQRPTVAFVCRRSPHRRTRHLRHTAGSWACTQRRTCLQGDRSNHGSRTSTSAIL